MDYHYVAYNDRGELVSGRLAADSEDAVAALLAQTGCRLLNLKRQFSLFNWNSLKLQFHRIKPEEVMVFYRQLALLLESGINVTTALELLQGQMENRTLQNILTEAVSELRGGKGLSATLEKHPTVFSRICCRTLAVGEQTGVLETMLRQMASYMEREVTASKSVKSALTYPVICLVVTIAVIGVLVGIVLPAFSNLYGELGAELPALTRFILNGASVLRSYAAQILMVVWFSFLIVAVYSRTPSGQLRRDRIMIKLPVLGPVNHMNELARCCRNISVLFHSGLPLTEIMPLVIQCSENKVMASALSDVNQAMLRGEGLSQPMSRNEIFPPMMVQMVKVGEETGNLDTTLLSVAQSNEAEAQDRTRALIGLVQPVMTLVIGAMVGLVALSMVSALYSIYGQAF